jgi:hypothetical protein
MSVLLENYDRQCFFPEGGVGLLPKRGCLLHSFTGAYSPGRTFGLPYQGFLITHIQTHGRTPLDE